MSGQDGKWYSEKYAAASQPEAPAPVPSPGQGIDGRFFALLGVGFLVAAIVGALLLRGSPSGSTAGATASPTARPTFGPTPTPALDQLALQQFWAILQDPKLSYHVETRGAGQLGSEAYSFSESLDVAGDDWKGTELAHGFGGVGAVKVVALDTAVWFKFPDGWHRNIEHDPYFRSRPLLGLDNIRDLVPSGTVDRNGVTLYDLKATTDWQPYPGRLIGFFALGMPVDTLELDVLVTADGVPVESTVHVQAGGLAANGKPQLDAHATRVFTKVGDAFTIVAPKS
jgi:hypothetical protein